jgi:PAS domain S-box-containing protein
MSGSNATRLAGIPSWSWDAFVDSVTDYALYALDPEGRVSTWNAGASRLKGYTADEIIGRHFSIFYTAEERAAGRPEHILEIVRERGRFEDEGWRVRKDGAAFWANVVITALRDEHGRLLGFTKVTRDLSVRRESEENARRLLQEQTARAVAEAAEQRLRESEERYRALSTRLEIVLEGVADGITVQDRSGQLVLANSAAARLCGFGSVDELLSAPPAEVVARFDMLDEAGRPFAYEDLPGRRVLAGAPSCSAVLHVRERRTGRNWWSSIRASAVLGSNGVPELAVNIWHDITTDHLAKREAKHLADASVALGTSLEPTEMLDALARSLVPALGDWCSVYVLERGALKNVTSIHADPEKMTLARDYQRRFPPDPSKPGLYNVVRSGLPELHNGISDELLTQATSDPAQLAILRGVGMRAVLLAPITVRNRVLGVISLISTELEDRYDEAHLALVQELGERAGVALENAQLYRAAQEAAKATEEASRAKDEFLATVSHELRTPLNAIVGWSSLLKDRVTDPALVKPIEVIHRNALAQVKIIEDILDVSRVITGKFRLDARPADLVAIARDALEVVRPSALAKSLSLTFQTEHEACLIVADPERVQQVVWNLLSNAVKFTEPPGKVTLSIHQEEPTSITLTVLDTGRGIEPTFLPYVFDRFRQGDPTSTRRVGGLGLGLALVRHIVELHGGSVLAQSEGVGKGAAFSIRLPIRAVVRPSSEPPPSMPASERPDAAPVSLRGLRVLVVDDEPDTLELIRTVLFEAGAEVETAPSAADGFVALQRFHPHVLVSDVAMPVEDGLSFMRRVRGLPLDRGGGVPSLALTAFARDEDRARSLAAGYGAHVGKPVDPDILSACVARLAAANTSPSG